MNKQRSRAFGRRWLLHDEFLHEVFGNLGEVDEDIGDHDHQSQSHQDADPAGRSLRIPTAEDRPEHDHGEG